MIILITGTPGSGKTLFTVSELLAGQFKDRPLFVNGIPQLLVPHTVLADADVERWHLGGVALEDGSPTFDVQNAVIVVDEVQRIARPRAASQKPPDWIAALETHRHKGVDFVIITQHPQLLDVNIRRLVGRHLHVRRTFALGAAVVYEWDHCENPGNVKQATTRLWRYPKAAFKLYKSSELHTKAGGKMPLAVWIAILAVLATPFLIWRASDSLFGGFAKNDPTKTVAKGVSGPAGAPAGPKKAMTANELVAAFKPRIQGMEHTAPIYDGLTTPKRVPVPAACIDMKSKGCKCFTQDATPYQADEALCKSIVAGGIFLAFLDEVKPEQKHQVKNDQVKSDQVAAPGGMTLIGTLPQAGPVAPPPAEPQPQRIASVKR